MSNIYSPQNRVIVKELEQENKTASGIIISPNTTDVDNLAKLGEVVVDAFVNIDGNTVKIPKGQRLFYSKFSGVKFIKDSVKYTSLSFSEIIAIDG